VTALIIRRMRAEVANPEPSDRERVDRLLRRLAERTLDERRAGLHGLSGEWCVRRLDIDLKLDASEPDASAAGRWADLIAESVRTLIPDGSRVIYYPNRGRALAELAQSLTLGRSDRAWAWRQLGLLAEPYADPDVDPGAALLAALRREPQLAVSAVVHAVREAGFSHLDRLLGEAGWVALAGMLTAELPLASELREPELALNEPESPYVSEPGRASAVVAHSTFADACLASVSQPSAAVIAAWAMVITAEVEPGRPQLATDVAVELARKLRTENRATPTKPEPSWVPARAGHAETQHLLTRQSPKASNDPDSTPQKPEIDRGITGQADTARRPQRSEVPPSPSPSITISPQEATTTVDASEAAEPSASVDIEAPAGAETAWAGLLFLLNTAEAAGLPDAIDEDRRLADRPLRWVLHQLGQRLVPIPATDPAALALAGLAPGAAPFADAEPTETEDIALAEHAGQWADVTRAVLGQALHDDEAATTTVWSLARRPGRIVADPGWLEVHLDLETVDIAVRRAGLDLDPGWVSWLGTVVRFRYV
jgi:hypothetical protein